MTDDRPGPFLPELLKSQALLSIRKSLLKNGECEEYNLIQDVVAATQYSWSQDPLVAIFQKHFLVRHCLYLLRAEFAAEGSLSLTLEPVRIALHRSSQKNPTLPDEYKGNLEQFYLDESHFFNTDASQVSELLASFWRRYKAYQNQEQYFQLLGMASTASWQEVKQRYRELAMTHHPDRGGNSKEFALIQEAYLALKATMAKKH